LSGLAAGGTAEIAAFAEGSAAVWGHLQAVFLIFLDVLL